jgi:tetratricopeptide (TPR) repeat protein
MTGDADALIEQGLAARREKRGDDARTCFEQAAAQCREALDRDRLARALSGLAQVNRDAGDPSKALALYDEIVAIRRTLEAPLSLAHALRHLADVARELDRETEAARTYDEALAIYRADAHTAPLELANALRGMALLKEATGDTAAAHSAWTEAGRLYRDADVDAGVAESARRCAALDAS